MKVTIIQPDIVWENKSLNLRKLRDLITPLFTQTDIVVLPEMFNTGFSMNPEHLCEPSHGETSDWMLEISQMGNFGVCGSFIVKEKEFYFNRWVFVSPEKDLWCYDKRHLFSMAGEDKIFSKGRKRLIFSFRGVRISPFICYDLRFPVWSRNRNDYDLMINAANWPESRREVWLTLLKARAIENQCYVAGANRIGTDGAGIKYSGDSAIINPRGMIIASAKSDAESSITGEVSMDELSDFRKKFPVNNDADNFILNF
jgi:omega-amidase